MKKELNIPDDLYQKFELLCKLTNQNPDDKLEELLQLQIKSNIDEIKSIF